MNAATKTHIACDNSQKIRVFVGEGGWRERGKRETISCLHNLTSGDWLLDGEFNVSSSSE